MAKVKKNERSAKEFDTIVRYQVEYAHLLQEKAHELLDSLECKSLSQSEIRDIRRSFQMMQSKSQEMIASLKMLVQLKNEVDSSLLELERAVKSNIDVASAKQKVKWLQRKLKIFLHLSRKACHMEYQKEKLGGSAKIPLQDLSMPYFDKLGDEERKQKLKWNSDDKDVINGKSVLGEIAEMNIEKKIFSLTSLDDESLNSDVKDYSAKDTSPEHKKESSEANVKSSNTELPPSTIKTDMVQKYWNSDHHRFEIANFMQKIDPSSWHALAISYPDSFLKGDEKFPDDEIPWRHDRTMSDASAFGQKSMEKVRESLQTLFHEIVDASVNSIKANEQSDYIISSRPARSRRNKQKTGKNTVVKKDDTLPYMDNLGYDGYERETTKLFSRPVSVVLPVVKQDPEKQFPRKPTVWCDLSKVDIPKHSSSLRGIKKGLKDVPTISTRRQTLSKVVKSQRLSLKQAIGRVAAYTKFTPLKKRQLERDGLKWKRIVDLLGDSGIKSQNREIVIDAFKSLSQLGVSQREVIHGIRSKMKKETDHHILYEASKCVLSLGWWDAFAVNFMGKALLNGKRILKLDALDTIINAKNAQFITKTRSDIANFIQIIMQFVKSKDQDLALKASLAIGRLCIVDSEARDHLYTRLRDVSFSVRAKALETLVRQMNCKDDVVIDAILFQLSNARNWKQRIAAATLLQYIGVKDANKEDPDKVFDVLEKLLWNHPCEEIRMKAAEVINEFGMRPKTIFLASKRLEDLDEDVRSNAVQMLSSMRLKGEKELRLLLDIMELDSSVNVRIQVIKTFDVLKWNDPRVIQSLQERQKGEGILAREAENVLNSLMSVEKTSST